MGIRCKEPRPKEKKQLVREQHAEQGTACHSLPCHNLHRSAIIGCAHPSLSRKGTRRMRACSVPLHSG